MRSVPSLVRMRLLVNEVLEMPSKSLSPQNPPLLHEAEALGYSRHIQFWADRRRSFSVDKLHELINIERKALRAYVEDGPFDDVWEAELFEELTDAAPEEIHDAGPGTFSAVAALALHGAVVVHSSNEGLLDDPPHAGAPFVLFFAAPDVLERIRVAALATGLAIRPEERDLWTLTGCGLGAFPEFASVLSSEAPI